MIYNFMTNLSRIEHSEAKVDGPISPFGVLRGPAAMFGSSKGWSSKLVSRLEFKVGKRFFRQQVTFVVDFSSGYQKYPPWNDGAFYSYK